MGAELFLVALGFPAFLCVGLTIASVGWRGDTDHRIEMLELRCTRLETELRHSRRWMNDREEDDE
jgi:hypothetical protein